MHNRDNRPLQNSMFLPDRSNLMKRSSMDYNLPLSNNLSNHNPSFNPEPPKQINNLISSPHSRPQQFQSFYQENPRSPKHSNPNLSANTPGVKNIDQALYDINEKLEKLSRRVEKQQLKLDEFAVHPQNSAEMTKKILNEVRQNLPLITGSNDVYEHIFNIKLDVKAIN